MPGEVIVKMHNHVDAQSAQGFLNKASEENGMQLKQAFTGMKVYHYKINEQDSVENAISELQSDPNVKFVEPNYIVNKATIEGNSIQPVSKSEVFQYKKNDVNANALSQVGVPVRAQGQPSLNNTHQKVSAFSSGKPIVAVIDTGLDINHDVFVDSNALWSNSGEIAGNGVDDDGNGYIDDVNGWNFVVNNGSMYDDEGHGTHVSGIVLSAGMDIFSAPYEESAMEIMPLKFLDDTGAGKTSDAISAIYYAVNNGADVINNSWGGAGYSESLLEAIAYSYANNVVFTAASGNAGSNNDSVPMYPASYDVPHVMSVAATTDTDFLASFSNFGQASVDLGSPGVFILSTVPCTGSCGYGTSSGTSMATPLVSGTAAMMLIEAPTMLPYQIKTILFGEADYVSQLQSKLLTDSRLNATDAVNFSKTAVIETTQPAYVYGGQRSLSSSSGGGGCGVVKNLYDEPVHKQNQNQPGVPWSVLFIVLVFSAPALLAGLMKSKNKRQHRYQVQRRKHDRYEIDSKVSVNVNGQTVEGSISSLSLGGVKMESSEALEQGHEVKMKIQSPCGKDEIEVAGLVVWQQSEKSYGVQFKDLQEAVNEQIREWTRGLKLQKS